MTMAETDRLRVVGPRGMFEAFLAERKKRGIDHWDEVWDGEVHLGAPRPVTQNALQAELYVWLKGHVERHELGRMLTPFNLREPGTGDQNFRCPDLGLLAPGEQRLIDATETWVDGAGGPTVVFEIRVPGDDTYEKLPFYAARGARWIVIIHRDTRVPEVHRLAGAQYVAVAAGPDGWVACEPLAVDLRAGQRKGKPALEVRDRLEPERTAAF